MRKSSFQTQESVRDLLIRVLRDPVSLATMDSSRLDLILRVARRGRVLGNLAVALQEAGCLEQLPPAAGDQLRSALVLAQSRARLAMWELDRIGNALRTSGFSTCIAMKGCAYLLLGLPNARGRIFADVDLMLPEQELEGVEAYLNRRGWRSQELSPYDQNYYRRWTHELPPLMHVEREVEIDLHHNVLPRTARLKPDSTLLLENTQALAESRFATLSNEDIVLHAMTHLLFNDDMADKLRDLVDIDVLLRYFSGADEHYWSRILRRAEQLDLRRATYYGLRYASTYLDSPVPDTIISAIKAWGPPAPIRWLMDRLVPRALFPMHPEHSSRLTGYARLLLYVRSHWIRMPPWLLAYHLTYKFFVTRIRPAGH
jgi:hypothetical protein